MALPQTIDPTIPPINEPAFNGAAEIRQIKQFLVDEFGFQPSPTQQTSAPMSITPQGVVSITQPGATVAADPSTDLGIATKQYVDSTGFRVISRSVGSNGNPLFDMINTSFFTQVYSGSVPANTLGKDGRVKVSFQGDVLNNTGGSQTITFFATYGGANVCQSDQFTFANPSNNRRAVYGEFIISAQGATNSQYSTSSIKTSSSTQPFNGGSMGPIPINSNLINDQLGHSILGVDSTQAQNFSISAIFSVTSNALEFRLFSVYMEIIASTPSTPTP